MTACKNEEQKPLPSVSAAATSSPCGVLKAKLCAEIGPNSGVCGLFEQNEFLDDRCRTMLNDLPQTLKDLRQMERSRLPLDPAMAARLKASDAPSFGHPDAKVTVVFFADYESRSSLSLGLFLPQLEQHYRAEDLRVVFRHFPIAKGRISRAAAEASLAAAAQGRFLQYNDCLFNSQHDLNEASLERCAKETKLDLPRFRSELSSAKYAPQVKSDFALGTEALISGAPYAFVNGQRYNGSKGAEGLRTLIDEILAPGRSPNSVAATH